MNPFKNLRIAICNDHAGYELKNKVVEYLQDEGVKKLKDFGAFSAESSDYPDYAHPMATAIENKEFDFGISICGSGNGISMTLNKHQGIRAALCWKPEIAALARRHNDANILSLPARFVSESEALDMIFTFFSAEFEGGRHKTRVDKIPC
ncbi:ribose-5-phosphate isomerase [Paludibacter propionicigenes WB4]|uniref:Ribose-5-phosphate isomerase n=1 Tax=Paludibacter propionicigenes (strain DSM 17365 / JCM 13257 / WB4) TaxID=694427 RepID=E4T6L0_PALPW|nr:ribose 5-phosphate isomerase B [Paludibacter propionicigenes]ADQ80354.1 ribose-5-phosphate isomerase [Paludibacter propionicigenes WB4]